MTVSPLSLLILSQLLLSQTALAQNGTAQYYVPNGIFNPEEIDLDFISQRLVSPQGLVTQFALELEVQAIFTTGWLVAGAAWQYAMLNTEGETQQALSQLQFLLSTNALALTVVRSLFDAARSLLSRLTITIFVFGWDTTINGIIPFINDPFLVGDFLFSPELLLLASGRAVANSLFFFSAVGPLYLFATNVYPDLRPPDNTTRYLVGDYDYYGDYTDGYYKQLSDPAGYTDWQTGHYHSPLHSDWQTF